MSPFFNFPFQIDACFLTQVDMLPKCTGKCGAEKWWSATFQTFLSRYLTISNEPTIGVEEGTRVIQTLFNIGTDAGLL